MMWPLFVRDLTLLARRRGLLFAPLAHAALACGFMLAWGEQNRVPVLRGASFYEQLSIVQWVFMTIAAPWMAARQMAAERRKEWTRLAALLGRPPGRTLGVRMLSVALCAIVTVAAGLPAAILAQQMSPVAAPVLALDQLTLLGFALAAAFVTVYVELTIENRLGSWLTAAGIAPLIFAMGGQAGAAAPLLAAILVVVAALPLTRWADRRLWYLAERRP